MRMTADERSFVPDGIDTDRWHGFEQRVRQRRCQALLDTSRQALATGNRRAAREALTEARALNPDAAGLTALEAELAAQAAGRIWGHPARVVAVVGAVVASVLTLSAAVILIPMAFRTPVETPGLPVATAPLPAPAPVPQPAATTGMATPTVTADTPPSAVTPAPPLPMAPLPEDPVAFALKRYARTFTGHDFDDCAVTRSTMGATTASAVCRTALTSIALTAPAATSQLWDVELSRHDNGWMIDRAVAREK